MKYLNSSSLKLKLKYLFGWFKEQVARFSIWHWEVARFPLYLTGKNHALYVGRKSQRDIIRSILGKNKKDNNGEERKGVAGELVVVTDFPSPGALCVPLLLNSVVPLNRSIEEIISNFHSQLRRDLKKNRARYYLKKIISDSEIDHADDYMLKPYALARHGESASQIISKEVRRMGQSYGQFDLLILDDVVVGCQMGHEYTKAGKRYWTSNRCGYPESVFSDNKKLREVNAINIHLALERAVEEGYDYYDIGSSLARPDDGLLEWKRRRGADLDATGNYSCMYVRLPKIGIAQFLWEAPLFALEKNKLTLHIGIPSEFSEEEVVNRYREMGFGGVYKVYLYAAKSPSEIVLDSLRSIYLNKNSTPDFEIKIIV